MSTVIVRISFVQVVVFCIFSLATLLYAYDSLRLVEDEQPNTDKISASPVSIIDIQPSNPDPVVEEQNQRKKQTFKSDAIVFFFHMHKAGGTSFCSLLRKVFSRERVPEKNCLGHRGEFPLPKDVRHCCGNTRDDQKKMFDYLKGRGLSAVANEDILGKEMLLDGSFIYITTIRNPFDRTFSQWKHLKRWHGDRVPEFKEWLKTFKDNEMVRELCGWFCKDIPKGQLEQQHLDLAKERLSDFDFIIVLEWYDASVKLIFETLQWDPHKYTIYHSSYGSKSISHVFEVMNQTDVVHEMFLMHQLDLELYSHGLSLNAADLRKTYGQDFIKKHTDCVDPCCSNRSPTKKCSLY